MPQTGIANLSAAEVQDFELAQRLQTYEPGVRDFAVREMEFVNASETLQRHQGSVIDDDGLIGEVYKVYVGKEIDPQEP
jgi:hypothetical protein